MTLTERAQSMVDGHNNYGASVDHIWVHSGTQIPTSLYESATVNPEKNGQKARAIDTLKIADSETD